MRRRANVKGKTLNCSFRNQHHSLEQAKPVTTARMICKYIKQNYLKA